MQGDFEIKNNVLINNDNNWKFLFSGDHRQFDFLTGESTISNQSIDAFNENIEFRRTLSSQLGIPFLHVVFPCKPIAMRTKLPKTYQDIKPLFDVFSPDKDVIYPLDRLLSCRESFSPDDTHTTPVGSWSILQGILDKFSLGSPDSPRFESSSTIGDLNRMLGLMDKRPFDKFTGLVGKEYKVLDVTNKHGLRGNSGIIRIIRNPNSVYKKTILIFGDSFYNNNLNSQIAAFFENVVFFRSPVIIEHVIRTIKPDFLLTGQAERYLSSSVKDQFTTEPMIRFMNGAFYDANKVPKAFYIALDAIFSRYTNPERYDHWVEVVDGKLIG